MTKAADTSLQPQNRWFRPSLLSFAGAVFIGLLLVLFGGDRADAAGCCKVSRSNGKIVIRGTVPYKGAKYITSFIKDSTGRQISGQRCAARAGNGLASVKITIPEKYVPNGRYRVISASANSRFTRYYSTASSRFKVSNSRGVYVEVKKGPNKVHRSRSADFTLLRKGAIRRTKCNMDGAGWKRCGRTPSYSKLSEGRHVFKALVLGRGDFRWKDRRVFTVDTKPPTKPKLFGDKGWTNDGLAEVRAQSTDAGVGIKKYQHQISKDGGTTWGNRKSGRKVTFDKQGGYTVRFRAIDKIGRRSAWSKRFVGLDMNSPSAPTVEEPVGTDPCNDADYPLTLSATGNDSMSGISHFKWTVRDGDMNVVDTATGPEYQLATRSDNTVYVRAVDRAGNESDDGIWETWMTCPVT